LVRTGLQPEHSKAGIIYRTLEVFGALLGVVGQHLEGTPKLHNLSSNFFKGLHLENLPLATRTVQVLKLIDAALDLHELLLNVVHTNSVVPNFSLHLSGRGLARSIQHAGK
jgi:hypothetical protein